MLRKLTVILLCIICYGYSETNNLKDSYISINGHKIHYYQLGTGRPIVLLTGYGVTSNFWSEDFVKCLSKNHSVYLFDYQGIMTNEPPLNADSISAMANDVHLFIKQLKLNHPDIVSWSMGGAVSIDLASAHPEDVGKMTLIAPLLPDNKIFMPQKPKPELKSNDAILNYVFGNNIYGYKSSALSFYESQIFKLNRPLFTTKVQRDMSQNAVKTWVNDPASLKNFNQVKANIKFILADHDMMLDPVVQTKMIGNSKQIVNVNNSGHAIFYEQSNLVCWFVVAK